MLRKKGLPFFIILILILLFSKPAMAQVSLARNEVERELLQIVKEVNFKMNKMAIEMERLATQAEERNKNFDKLQDRVIQNRCHINDLSNAITELKATWKTYIATGGLGGLIAALFTFWIKKKNIV